MRLLAALITLLASLGAAPVLAQDLPQWQSQRVNDFAGLLTPEDAEAISRRLADLDDETGVEGVVVTLPDRARHGGTDGLEPFATRLFNHWGVGDQRQNDGFMLLVLKDDREARIELGRGYENDADIIAQDILRGTILPAFRDGGMSQGLRQGTSDIIKHIVLPRSRGEPLERREKSLAPTLLGVGLWAVFLALFGRHLWRRNRCPQCRQRGLVTARSPHREPEPDGSYRVAADEVTQSCPHCGWSQTRRRANRDTIWYDREGSRLASTRNRGAGPGGAGPGGAGRGDGASGFGGGSSRGGGASGRW